MTAYRRAMQLAAAALGLVAVAVTVLVARVVLLRLDAIAPSTGEALRAVSLWVIGAGLVSVLVSLVLFARWTR